MITVSDLLDVLEDAELLPPANTQPNKAPNPTPEIVPDCATHEMRS